MGVCIQISSTLIGGMSLASTRVGRPLLESERVGGMRLSSSFVCEVSRLAPYLEIEPTVLWMTEWGVQNEVFSNTRWRIE